MKVLKPRALQLITDCCASLQALEHGKIKLTVRGQELIDFKKAERIKYLRVIREISENPQSWVGTGDENEIDTV